MNDNKLPTNDLSKNESHLPLDNKFGTIVLNGENGDIGPVQVADQNSNNQNGNQVKRKNRTLQFYKFLLYSLKTEIKAFEFYKLIKISSTYEVGAFILSFALLLTGKFYIQFVILSFLHFVRGCIGFQLLQHLPRSYQLIDNFSASDSDLESKIFNDIMRDNVKKNVFEALNVQQRFLLYYFVLNVINYFLDIIAFFISLGLMGDVQRIIDFTNCKHNCSLTFFYNDTFFNPGNITMGNSTGNLTKNMTNPPNMTNPNYNMTYPYNSSNSTYNFTNSSNLTNSSYILKNVSIPFELIDFRDSGTVVIYVTIFLICLFYLLVDIAYLYWAYSLKFTYPKSLLNPVYDAFLGKIEEIKKKLKLVYVDGPENPQVEQNANNNPHANSNDQPQQNKDAPNEINL